MNWLKKMRGILNISVKKGGSLHRFVMRSRGEPTQTMCETVQASAEGLVLYVFASIKNLLRIGYWVIIAMGVITWIIMLFVSIVNGDITPLWSNVVSLVAGTILIMIGLGIIVILYRAVRWAAKYLCPVAIKWEEEKHTQ